MKFRRASRLAHIHHKRLIRCLRSPLCQRVTLRVVQPTAILSRCTFVFCLSKTRQSRCRLSSSCSGPLSPCPTSVLVSPTRSLVPPLLSRWLAILSASRYPHFNPPSLSLFLFHVLALSDSLDSSSSVLEHRAGVLHPFVLHASYHRLPGENAGNLPRSFSPALVSPLPLVRVSSSSTRSRVPEFHWARAWPRNFTGDERTMHLHTGTRWRRARRPGERRNRRKVFIMPAARAPVAQFSRWLGHVANALPGINEHACGTWRRTRSPVPSRNQTSV